MSDFDKRKYDIEYRKRNYRSIQLHIPFADNDELDNHIKQTGESKSAFIKRAIKETIEEETGLPFEEATENS